MKRIIATIIVVLGIASLVLGVIFITQAASGKQTIADNIQPLPISEVDARYEQVKAQHMALMAIEQPGIQAGTAMPSSMYNYLTVQRTSLGLTRSNIGITKSIRTNGIIDIILGAGLILAGSVLYKQD